MKTKHFYEHLIQINEITLDLGDLEMSQEERLHLLSLLEANIHNAVLQAVLSELPGEEKKVFLSNLVLNDHNKIWEHLWRNTTDMEQKITASVNKLLKEMREDIKKIKSQN
jgi:hypothetical protein